MKAASLSALTTKAIAGDDEALTDLVRIHHDRVYRFGKRFCRPEDLDDAVQEAFITLARRQDVMKHAGVVSWLFTVVKHTCLRLWRSVRRQQQRLGERIDVVDAPIADARLDPEQELLRFELVQAVQTSIAELGDESRAVIVLVDLEGFSGADAAEALGISVPALKARLHRARTALRASLASSGRTDAN
ncbi:MAG: RNA polymerase sigma factor [Proteobacteria bacterium]|nr:RNA polymerase sigma factor [Pseudomonadota bacterium]